MTRKLRRVRRAEMRIEALRLTHKAGGKSGEFIQD